MILPGQPAKFGARKNENNFIQVSEAYNYNILVRCVENETFSIVTHRIRATDRTS